MKSRILFVLVIISVLCSCVREEKNDRFTIPAGELTLVMDTSGRIISLIDNDSKQEYLHPDSMAYLIRMRFDNTIITPMSLDIDADQNMMYFIFPDDREVKVRFDKQEKYLRFELFNIRSEDKPDLLVWGPLFTSIDETIGETVGVVRNDDFAIGIQSLDPRTLGGYPWRDNDVMPEIDYFSQDDYSDLRKGGIGQTLYRVEAARPVPGGSALHAYCRNRYYERSIDNWGYTNYVSEPYKDGGLIGSAIAIFGCSPDDVLDNISVIEVAEGLPHPTLYDEWSKTAPEASAAYMILGFGRKDIEKALLYTEKAGLKYLYHPGPFDTWGHFMLNKDYFPEGRKSLKECVDIAADKGISIGLHTLSNFITTNDSYVTPVPDQRLAEVGRAILTHDIEPDEDLIVIDDPSRFNQYTNNYLKAARIGDEIIRYAAVSESEPWTLIDCQRGAFGTQIKAHNAGDTIAKLADHAYKVLLSNSDLTVEIGKNIAKLFNETGVRQISFDGLEGCRSTGMGNYGEILLTNTWYNWLDDDIRSHYIADASRTSHYFWHIFTRMNWGEPWYAGFRESQTEYRLKNQKYFDRNYIPNMLGWFLMRPNTSIEDIEWLLARSAAFNAGFAFVSSYEAFKKNGNTEQILALIGLWENTRMQDIFPEGTRKLMEDVNNEFNLQRQDDNSLLLTRIYPFRAVHSKKSRQPGEPDITVLAFENPGEEQVLQFIITAAKGKLLNPVMEIDGSRSITVPVVLNEEEHVKYNGEFAEVYSANWQLLKSISLEKSLLTVSPGNHSLDVSCNFTGSEGEMKVELRLAGERELLQE